MTVRSALTPDRQPLWLGLFVSMAGHGFIAAAWIISTLLMSYFSPSRPLIDDDDVMTVALIAKSDLPTRAVAPPKAAGRPQPKESPKPPPADAPPVQSDLALQTEEAPETPEGEEAPIDVSAALDELEMLAALDSLDNAAPSQASSPDGVGDVSVGTGATAGDAELALYLETLRQLFNAQFRIPDAIRQQNPDLRVVVSLQVDDSGRITSRQTTRSSGVPFIDKAAENAVDAVGTIPLPPESLRDRMSEGYSIEFI